MKRGSKYCLYGLLGLLGLLVVLVLTTQTRFFKNWVRDFAVEKANESLNGELSIARIDGSFFTNLEISNILVKMENDTVLFMPKFRLELSPLRILQGEIRVDAVFLERPYLKLAQLPDSTWNVSGLVRVDSTEQPHAVESSEPFGYQISLADFYLNDASIRVASPDTLIPKSISDLSIRLAGFYSEQAQELDLKEFRLKTENPNFELRELTFSVLRNEQQTLLEDFVLTTAENRLDAKAKYFTAADSKSEGQIESQPIDFDEFKVVVPTLSVGGHPTFSLRTVYQNDRLEADLEIVHQDQGFRLQGWLGNVTDAIEDPSSAEVRYSLRGVLSNVDLAHWLNDSTMAYILNAQFELDGQGLTPDNAEVNMEARFPDCVLLGRPVEDISITADYRQGELTTSLDILGDFGEVALAANVIGVADTQSYHMTLELNQINAAQLMMDDSMQTDVDLKLTARGASFDPETATGWLEVRLQPSTLIGINIDTLWSSLQFGPDQIAVDTLHLASPFLKLVASGMVSLEAESDLQFRGELGDLMTLNDFIEADTVHATGEVKGHVTGTLDSLLAVVGLGFKDVLFNENFVDSLVGTFTLLQSQTGPSGEGEIRIKSAGTPDLSIDQVEIRSTFTPEVLDVVLDLAHQTDIRANLHTQIVMDSIPRVLVSNMDFEFKGQNWSGGGAETEIILHPDYYEIHNFELASQSESSSEQFIKVDGAFSLTGDEDLRVDISGIDVGALAPLLQPPMEVDGNFFFNLQVSGTADSPIIIGDLVFRDGKLGQYAFQALQGRMDYRDERLGWHFGFLANATDSLSVDGHVPVNLALTNQGDVLHSTRPLGLRVKSARLPLDIIKAGGVAMESVDGYITCDIRVENTLAEPRPSGYLALKDGAIELPDFGVDYTDFQMRLSLDSATVTLDTLHAKRDEGLITASGFFAFDSSLVSGQIRSTQFHLLADEFYLARHRDYEIQISADAEFGGDVHSPRFGGEITVLRSSFFLPAFMDDSAAPAVPDDGSVPMLVAATRDLQAGADSLTVKGTIDRGRAEQSEFDIYKELRGTFKVTIPKNTWLKSPDMRLEIAGDLDLVKNGPDLEIFGPIQVVRGHYDLRGRRFNFVKGLLTFQGGSEYNPVLDLQLEYIFRTADREKKSLVLFVTGKAFTPELKFTLADDEITEGDAISYIMFGRSLDELTGGQRSSVAGSGGDSGGSLAQGLAADLVAQQLTKTLGNKLNLDFIEIKSQDRWQNATFVVGKYLTNDLFMSYERGFGQTENDDIQPAIITLEYELTRFLFLQLIDGNDSSSGYDVIFKFER